MWGGAVAACQIEGAYDVDGRGLSTSDIHAFDKHLDRAHIKKEGGGTLAAINAAMEDKESYFPKRHGIDFYHTYKERSGTVKEMGFRRVPPSVFPGPGSSRTAMKRHRMKRGWSFTIV